MAKIRHAEVFNGVVNSSVGALEFVDGVAEITDEQADFFRNNPISDIRMLAEKGVTPPTGNGPEDGEGGDAGDGDSNTNPSTVKAPPKRPGAKS